MSDRTDTNTATDPTRADPMAERIALAVGDMVVWPEGVNDETTLRELLESSFVADADLLSRAATIAATVMSEPASLPCKSGEGADHGLGLHATVVDDCEDGFMSVAIVVGENVYLAQGGEQITMSREQFAEIAKTLIDATQTREADIPEAIRKAKIEADKVYGIAWHRLEEVSRVELILAALNTRGRA